VKTRYGTFGLACMSLTALGLLAAPCMAQTPDTPGSDPASGSEASNQAIKIDLENTDLYSALKLLFAQIKANYTLDPSLRQVPVTAHLNAIPFRIALDQILRGANSPVPLTYRVENGIYTIIEKKEVTNPDEAAAAEDTPTKSNKLTYKKFYGSTGELKYNSFYIASLLGAKMIPSIIGQQQGQGGFGAGGFGGGMSGGGGFGGGMGGMSGGMGGMSGGMGGMSGGMGGMSGGMGGMSGGMGGGGGRGF
jgi:hypothetical protein